MKVKFEGGIARSWGFKVRVLAGPEFMRDKIYRVMAEAGHSCVGLGQSEGYIVLRQKPASYPIDANAKSEMFLEAVEYEPSFWNEVLRFFGGRTWNYPGKRGSGKGFY